ncbi:MAG: hypothetical protein OYL92_03835 [Acidobacteriota bacterium]|nr:hypothetical protein [Acidobacteriota bacterium]MDE3264081.1 hypothetical protein [Acidobacteriota bacterium]
MTSYFSDREGRVPPQPTDQIDDRVWGGIRAAIETRVNNNSFAQSYSNTCTDNNATVIAGTNEEGLRDAMHAEVPGLPNWPWLASTDLYPPPPPATPSILDLVEFCSRKVAIPVRRTYHNYGGMHEHLFEFDEQRGQREFREEINRIFERNGVTYRLNEERQVQRLVEPVFRKTLEDMSFRTDDPELDRMLSTAQTKFLNRRAEVRREALEALWRAWERLKTLRPGANKKVSATALLREAAGSSSTKYLQLLEVEAKQLTDIGNTMQIRHSETDQERLDASEHVDYLFYRLWAFLSMLLLSMGHPRVVSVPPLEEHPPQEPTPNWLDDDIPF